MVGLVMALLLTPQLRAADEEKLLELLRDFNAAEWQVSRAASTDQGGDAGSTAVAWYGLGNAFIDTAEFRVDADAIGAYLTPATETTPASIRVVAIGNVLLVRGRQSVRAETLFYDQGQQRVVITDARLRADLDFIDRPPTFNREAPVDARDRWGGAAETMEFNPSVAGETEHSHPLDEPHAETDLLHEDEGATGARRGTDVASELSETRRVVPEHRHGRVVVAAQELRGEHFDRLRATGVSVTTCDFGDPHWSVEASGAVVERHQGAAPATAGGEKEADSYTIDMESTGLRVFDTTIPFFPGFHWNTKWTENFPLRSAKYSSSSRFGQRIDTLWSGQGLLPRSWRPHIDLGLRLEYLSDRGTAYGGELEYGQKPGRWADEATGYDIYGTATYYRIDDRGEDANDVIPETEHRGRTRAHQRIRTPWGMWIDAEYAVESDRGFLEEYFESESRSEKPPESLIYVRQPISELSSINLLAKSREVRYRSVVERVPELSVFVIERPVGAGFDLDLVGRASKLNFEPDKATASDNRRNTRGDLRATLAREFGSSKVFKVRPFIEARATSWEEDVTGDDSIDRFSLATGGSWGVHLSRVFHGEWGRYDALRHVIDPTVRYRVVFENDTAPSRLFRYDSTEDVRRMEVLTFGVRSYLYGRVAAPSGARSVAKLVEVDFEVDYFPEAARDNSGELWGPVFGEVLLQAFPGATYYVDLAYDVENGPRFQEFHNGVRFVHQPTLTTVGVGTRYRLHVGHSLNASWVWEPTDRYAFDVFYDYDFRREEVVDQYYSVVRNFHRWAMMVTLEIDEGEDDHVQLSVRFGPREFWRAIKGSLRDRLPRD